MTNIIEQIHSEFSQSEQLIVDEAKALLREEEEMTLERKETEKAQKLRLLGFTGSKNVKPFDPRELQKAKELIELQKVYQKISPHYRFITEKKRVEICKKYGIVMATVDRFIGRIPDKNVDDIVNFKILDSSYLKQPSKVRYRWENVEDMDDKHLLNTALFWESRSNYRKLGDYHSFGEAVNNHPGLHAIFSEIQKRRIGGYRDSWTSPDGSRSLGPHFRVRGSRVDFPDNFENRTEIPELYIVSNIDQLNQEGALLDEDKMFLSENKYQQEEQRKRQLLMQEDPIVLANVKGGYLIVTSWGAEASDVDVHNFNHN